MGRGPVRRLRPNPLPWTGRRSAAIVFFALCTHLATAAPAPGEAPAAAPSPGAPAATLVVGVKQAPPFALREANGDWEGLAVELWEAYAEREALEWRYEERDLDGLLSGVASGELDVGVGALTVTAAREERMDFSHPFHTSGLSIAVVPRPGNPFVSAARTLVSETFTRTVLALSTLLLAVGLVVWLAERRKNPEQFGAGLGAGLFNAFWWSAVTMTTVGYGDVAPRTVLGRLVGLVWMFASILLISSFTAALASALTVRTMESPVQDAADLHGVRVGTVPASASADWLAQREIAGRGYPTVQEAVTALQAGELDAVVYDGPLLEYLAGQTEGESTVHVLPQPVDHEDYAFAFPPGSPLRERVNRVLLVETRSPRWAARVHHWLGD